MPESWASGFQMGGCPWALRGPIKVRNEIRAGLVELDIVVYEEQKAQEDMSDIDVEMPVIHDTDPIECPGEASDPIEASLSDVPKDKPKPVRKKRNQSRKDVPCEKRVATR